MPKSKNIYIMQGLKNIVILKIRFFKNSQRNYVVLCFFFVFF